MKKELALLFIGLLALVAIVLVSAKREQSFETSDEVSVGGATVSVAVARTPAEQSRGLSGVPSLPEGKGMLFVFSVPGRHGFWMRGMAFPIDIIWFDESGTIVGLKEHASPSSYPEVFTPDAPSSYVLEVRAGFAAAHGVKKGDKVSFTLSAPPAPI